MFFFVQSITVLTNIYYLPSQQSVIDPAIVLSMLLYYSFVWYFVVFLRGYKSLNVLYSLFISVIKRGGSCWSIFSFLCSVLQIIVCPFVSFRFVIILSVILRFTASDYPFGILDLRLLITPWYLRFTASDYPFGILDLRLLNTPLVSQIYGF